ncbi:MAG TPA: hypothetical protein VGC87_01645 [Pyrinomonadaceae bacterium]|jgi:hypothetical protein
MRDFLARALMNIADRVGGPMTFRLILQPLMAALLALRAGLKDAREDRPPYFWAVLTNRMHRPDLLREGWRAVGRVFILAVVMDIIYQWIVQRGVYPGEVVIVAIILAVVPYLLIRGPVNRIARRRQRDGKRLAVKSD